MTVRLAIDTATDTASVGVGRDSSVLGQVAIGPRRHAASLVPSVLEVLKIAGLSLQDVEEFVVADGPGSFTGLRIGWATMQGLLLDHPRPVLAIPSLMAMARGASGPPGEPVLALYSALRGQVYAAIYSFTETDVTVHTEPILTTVGDLRGLAPVLPALAVGDGALAFEELVRDWIGRPALAPPRRGPEAQDLLALAELDNAGQVVEDPATFEPRYGRLAEAQARWERAHGRPLHDPASES